MGTSGWLKGFLKTAAATVLYAAAHSFFRQSEVQRSSRPCLRRTAAERGVSGIPAALAGQPFRRFREERGSFSDVVAGLPFRLDRVDTDTCLVMFRQLRPGLLQVLYLSMDQQILFERPLRLVCCFSWLGDFDHL